MIAVCDTGPVVAAFVGRDRHHSLCLPFFQVATDTLLVPVTVIAEVDYFVRSRGGASTARHFLSTLGTGNYDVAPVAAPAFARARALDLQYADAELGIVDASVIAIAEEVEADVILTLDHADFRLAAPGFTLLPAEHEL